MLCHRLGFLPASPISTGCMGNASHHNSDGFGPSQHDPRSITDHAQPLHIIAQQPIWLSVEQIRIRERMGRSRVIAAMDRGELPFEQRGRVRFARLSDVVAWEDARLRRGPVKPVRIRRDLSDLL